MDKSPFQIAYELSISRLSRKECSSKDLRDYLVRRECESPVIDEVLESLIREGLLSDQRYARLMVRHQYLREKGPAYIRQKLREKGISLQSTEIQKIITEVSETPESETAERVLIKKYPKAGVDPKERRKAFSALMRRGFSSDVAQRALSKVFPKS